MLSRLALTLLAAMACATAALGQAAVEYALKSSQSTLSGGGSGTIIAGCKVDSTVVACLSRSYPKTTIIVIALLTLVIWRWLTRPRPAL